MSRELIVLSPHRPEVGERYLFDPQGRLLVRIQEPVLVPVPGEVERLLGTPSPTPVWWTELHTAADSPEAEQLARDCAERLGGTIWP
ncbi:hypothetical protein [Actinomadura sp. 9N215]|uniref:hypothetical protein n=1 Tax=Actinomadura sp. 9N215 TaxID=3375150 RepID=UPI00379C4EB1